jgi:hypothetical protein
VDCTRSRRARRDTTVSYCLNRCSKPHPGSRTDRHRVDRALRRAASSRFGWSACGRGCPSTSAPPAPIEDPSAGGRARSESRALRPGGRRRPLGRSRRSRACRTGSAGE